MEQIKLEVKRHMKGLSDLYFSSESMRDYAYRFIDKKIGEPLVCGALTVWHYRMFGGMKDDIYRIAAGVELLILSSDILDDLQDQDAPSMPWMQIPHAEAMNVAIGLLLVAQQAIFHGSTETNIRLLAMELVQEKLLDSLNGQMQDICNQMQDVNQYLDMTKKKSASLFVIACGLGVLYASGKRHPIVESYAEYMGMSAQLYNDCKDIFNWKGKSDFTARKRTLPMLYLMNSVEGPDMWVKAYMDQGAASIDIEIDEPQFKDLCERYGVVLYTQFQMQMYYYEFMELFNAVPETEVWKEDFLREFTFRTEQSQA